MSEPDTVYRTILPIPDQPHVGLTTYNAKDPDTKYPPIRELRPPEGAANILIILLDDVRVRCVERLWWSMPNTELGEACG